MYGVYVMVCVEVRGQLYGIRSLIPATWDLRVKPKLVVGFSFALFGVIYLDNIKCLKGGRIPQKRT